MMTECMQNEQDENDDQDQDPGTTTEAEMNVDENDAQCIRREITVGLDAWTRGWDDGVGCMSQHGVGTGLG